jgi:toxin ParE1/3/4
VTGRVVRSDGAERDLDEIGLHIARQSGSLNIALRFLDRINDRCAAYARQPEMGDPRPDLGASLRLFPVGDYVVVYRPLDDGILVLLVAHGSRRIRRLLRDRL